jgi:hypothetical protein
MVARELVVTYRRQAAQTLDDAPLDSVGTAEKIMIF